MMSQIMRIVIFTDVFHPKVDGVVKRLTGNIESLVASGHQVLVVTSAGYAESYPGIRVVNLPSVRLASDKDVRFGVRSTPDALRIVREFEPEVAHAVAPCIVGVGILGIRMAEKFGIPLVTSFQTHYVRYIAGNPIWFWLKPFGWQQIRAIYNRGDVVLTTSEPMRDELEEQDVRGRWRKHPDGAEVLLWSKVVCTEEFSPEHRDAEMRRRLAGGDSGVTVLLFVGRLSREKRIDSLRPILDRVDGVVLALVGDGPDRARLEEHFRGYPVIFHGILKGSSLAAAYASSDLFLFPSTFDTLGFVVLEAMASGLPVVTAGASGCSTSIDHGKSGYIYDPDHPDEAVEYVRMLTLDEGLRSGMGRAARERAREIGSWEANARDLLRIYQEAVRRSRAYAPSRPATQN